MGPKEKTSLQSKQSKQSWIAQALGAEEEDDDLEAEDFEAEQELLEEIRDREED